MSQGDRMNNDAADADMPGDATSGPGERSSFEGGAGAVTPNAEVMGNDPASTGEGGIGGTRGSEGGQGSAGDWDPASSGGGGGEVY